MGRFYESIQIHFFLIIGKKLYETFDCIGRTSLIFQKKNGSKCYVT